MIDKQSQVAFMTLALVVAGCGAPTSGQGAVTTAAAESAQNATGSAPKTIENGGPQSRMYRGGKLEKYEYLFDPNGASFSAQLPATILGHVNREGDSNIVLKPSGERKIGNEMVRLYEPILQGASGPENLCEGQSYVIEGATDASLDGKAVAIPGYWEYQGAFRESVQDKPERKPFTLSCATGVIAKCMLRGYVPSASNPDQNTTMKSLFDACLRASRSQPAAEPTPLTCNGTIIDIYDNFKIQTLDTKLGETYTFEAAWNDKGMVCSNHPRYSGCNELLKPLNIPQCPEDVANGNVWEMNGTKILLKTRSAMVDSPKCPYGNEEICNR